MITWIRTPTFAYSSEEELDYQDYGEEILHGGPERRHSDPAAPPTRIERIRRSLINPYLQKRAKYKDFRNSFDEIEDFELVHFLAGGQRMSCPDHILTKYPSSTLGDPARRMKHYCISKQIFDFSTTLPDVFEAVLEFYEGTPLVRPDRLTVDYFLEQLEIFEFEASLIGQYLLAEGVKSPRRPHMPTTAESTWKDQVWEFLRFPELTTSSRCFNGLSLVLTCLSIAIYILETVPELPFLVGSTSSLSEAFQNPFFGINTICYVFFTVELALRFVSCPDKKGFFKKWYNCVDLISIVAHVIVLIVIGTGISGDGPHFTRQVGVIRAVRLFRILKPIGVSKTVGSPSQYWIEILWRTVSNNAPTLLVLLFLLLLCMVLFAGIGYAIEGGPNSTIRTIPHGFWWAIITMTTVGYGDITPMYVGGQVVSLICGSVGLIFMAFLLHSVSSGYQRLMKNNSEYRRYLARRKLRKMSQKSHSDSVIISTSAARLELPEIKLSGLMGEMTILVNGSEFVIKMGELALFPETLLGHTQNRRTHLFKDEKTVFFARSAAVFPAILAFYKNKGSLRRPPFVPMRKFVQELIFYELGEKALIDLFAAEGICLVKELEPNHPAILFWYRVWHHPEFNFISRLVGVISILVITLSVVTLVLETIPEMWTGDCSVSNTTGNATLGRSKNFKDACAQEWIFFILESVCTAWYILELFSRFAFTPEKVRFLKAIMNWVDALSIFPYFFTLAEMFSETPTSHTIINSFGFLRTIRLVRLIALFKFSRFSRTMQMILTILRSAWFELCMSGYFIFVMAIIFGTVCYLFEQGGPNPNITSIPRGMYWAWITMLTIGYGDIVPSTIGGFVTGGFCAIAGTLFWSLPMTLVADHYAKFRMLYNDQEFMIAVLERLERAHRKREGMAVNERHLVEALDLSKLDLSQPAAVSSEFVSFSALPYGVKRNHSTASSSVMRTSLETDIRPGPRSRSLDLPYVGPTTEFLSNTPVSSLSAG